MLTNYTTHYQSTFIPLRKEVNVLLFTNVSVCTQKRSQVLWHINAVFRKFPSVHSKCMSIITACKLEHPTVPMLYWTLHSPRNVGRKTDDGYKRYLIKIATHDVYVVSDRLQELVHLFCAQVASAQYVLYFSGRQQFFKLSWKSAAAERYVHVSDHQHRTLEEQ